MAPNRSIVPLLSLKLKYQASFPYKFKDYSWGDYIVLISLYLITDSFFIIYFNLIPK